MGNPFCTADITTLDKIHNERSYACKGGGRSNCDRMETDNLYPKHTYGHYSGRASLVKLMAPDSMPHIPPDIFTLALVKGVVLSHHNAPIW